MSNVNDMENRDVTVEEYLTDYKFVIPEYQRGYKWGVRSDTGVSSAEYFLKNLIQAYRRQQPTYYIQGITACCGKTASEIVLIDGQQRTTTLFLLLSILLAPEQVRRFLFDGDALKLAYLVRKQSGCFLAEICKGMEPDAAEECQDKYYLYKAFDQMRTMANEELGEDNYSKFADYILKCVRLYLVRVNPEQAEDVFSMLNGAKAEMRIDELIKAEFLSKVDDGGGVNVRGMYARQWDRWQYWWLRPAVAKFWWRKKEVLGVLLKNFFMQNAVNHSRTFNVASKDIAGEFGTFITFLEENFHGDTKNAFCKLRRVQKHVEDLYADVSLHNLLGLALAVCSDRDKVVELFLAHIKDVTFLEDLVLLLLVGFSPSQAARWLDLQSGACSSQDENIEDDLIRNKLLLLLNEKVYDGASGEAEEAYLQLFRLNVELASQNGRLFQFFYKNDDGRYEAIYSKRSLEHVWPKSKFCDEIDQGFVTGKYLLRGNLLDFKCKIGGDVIVRHMTEHSLGNLLFLHKDENSEFKDALPEGAGGKKSVYFDIRRERPFRSRELMHTLSVFAGRSWDADHAPRTIADNFVDTFSAIIKPYESMFLRHEKALRIVMPEIVERG